MSDTQRHYTTEACYMYNIHHTSINYIHVNNMASPFINNVDS